MKVPTGMRWALCAALAACIGGRSLAADKVGDQRDGGTIVPTQQLVRPAGDVLTFPGGAVDLVVSRDGKVVYVKGTKALLVVDADQWTVRQELKYPSGGGSMHGIALSHDGNRLFVGGSVATLWAGDVAADGTVKWAENDHKIFADMQRWSVEILKSAGAEIHTVSAKPATNHELGGCRMGSDARTSVVNADCRTHDVPNLYVVDGSVFPSASEKNPTLTIMALAARLADHMAETMRRGDKG